MSTMESKLDRLMDFLGVDQVIAQQSSSSPQVAKDKSKSTSSRNTSQGDEATSEASPSKEAAASKKKRQGAKVDFAPETSASSPQEEDGDDDDSASSESDDDGDLSGHSVPYWQMQQVSGQLYPGPRVDEPVPTRTRTRGKGNKASKQTSTSPRAPEDPASGQTLTDASVPNFPTVAPPAMPVITLNQNLKADYLSSLHDDVDPEDWYDNVVSEIEAQSLALHPLHAEIFLRSALGALPTRLKGKARKLYIALRKHDRQRLSVSLEAWRELIVEPFLPDIDERRMFAYDREWDMDEESCEDYIREKKKLLVRVDPGLNKRRNARQLWTRVRAGVTDPTLWHILGETTKPEPSENVIIAQARVIDRIAEHRREQREAQETVTKAMLKAVKRSATASASQRDFQHPPASAGPSKGGSSSTKANKSSSSSSGPFSAVETYDASRRKVTMENGKRVVTYLRADGSLMRLTRPCRHCGGEHFDFEHDALTSKAKSNNMAGGPLYVFNNEDVAAALADSDYETGVESITSESAAEESASGSGEEEKLAQALAILTKSRTRRPSDKLPQSAKKSTRSPKSSQPSFRKSSAQKRH